VKGGLDSGLETPIHRGKLRTPVDMEALRAIVAFYG